MIYASVLGYYLMAVFGFITPLSSSTTLIQICNIFSNRKIISLEKLGKEKSPTRGKLKQNECILHRSSLPPSSSPALSPFPPLGSLLMLKYQRGNLTGANVLLLASSLKFDCVLQNTLFEIRILVQGEYFVSSLFISISPSSS